MVHREGELLVAECSEVGTVSQGGSLAEARANLRELQWIAVRPFVIVLEALA
jgi:predicted RNase H-like HicB family nuclease